MTDFIERYSIVLDALLDKAKSDAERDLCGERPTRKARLQGAIDAIEDCDGKGPGDLEYMLEDQTPTKACPDGTNQIFYDAEYERTLKWICECMSVFLVLNGQSEICNPSGPAALEMLSVCQGL